MRKITCTGKTSDEVEADRIAIVSAELKAKRNALMQPVINRIDRYRNQSALGVTTTDSADTYKALLQALEDYRSMPEQAGFPEVVTWPEIRY